MHALFGRDGECAVECSRVIDYLYSSRDVTCTHFSSFFPIMTWQDGNNDNWEYLNKINKNNDDANQDDDEEQEVNYGDNDMGQLCSKVYETSAHCHRNYRSFRKGQLTERQWDEMKLSCSFIDSIVMGNYDEMGYVNLNSNGTTPEWLRDNKYAQDMYNNVVSDVSALQVFLLVFALLACAILAMWSKTLHSSLTKREPWAPGRKWSVKNVFCRNQESPELAPVESGIGASRVRSDGTSYYVT